MLAFDCEQPRRMFQRMKSIEARKRSWLWLMLVLLPGFLASVETPLAAAAPAQPAASIVAPELIGDAWLNVPKGTTLSLAARKGKVTVLHFWTYGCINCKRNLLAYERWQKRFAAKGVIVIGIHSPETEEEQNPVNVAKKVKELGITYPVLIDTGLKNWNRWQQRVWPAICLIDKQGRARYGWEGELEYRSAGGEAKLTQLIEALLKE
jgi:thiol-disulfide isomerase/thioredoxin